MLHDFAARATRLTGIGLKGHAAAERIPSRPGSLQQRVPVVKTVSVSTTCPYCGGSTLLLTETEFNPSKIEIGDRFAGKHIECQHPGCGRLFLIRRSDLTIRRSSRIAKG
jgi:hypothetical protein